MENPGEKRILEEYDKIKSYHSKDFMFRKLDWNSYEWQGALRGPSGSHFAGGIYHVRLLFAKEYPREKPSFIFLTENGSFNIQTKTNATLKWDPSSSRMEQAFIQLIELMPECPDFKSDSEEEHKDKRRDLAKKSSEEAPIYGTDARQKLINVNHQYMQRRWKFFSQLTEVANRKQQGAGGYVANVVGNAFNATNSDGEEVVVDRVGPTQMESDRSVIVEDNYNIQNSGEKQILEEYHAIKSNPSSDFTCLKLDWNPYEWQFAIRGQRETEFDGGIYHGMVKFSEGYPSNPPSIVFLTKNGCFDTQTIISLSNWQSSSVQDTIVAFIEHMATYSNGGLVSVKRVKRRYLAIKSHAKAPKYGTLAREEVMDEIHQHMLSNTQLDVNNSKWLKVFMVIVCPFCSYVILQKAAAVYANITSSGCVVNISGNTFNVNNSERVGVFDFWKEAPNPMGIFLVFMLYVMVLFCSLVIGDQICSVVLFYW
ncbi:ubiquitin-conjugating enzyme E2 J2-like [Prunus yedoensis var. nudiflora]|uniref:Ubiquitin-conjugating enzyme E2 J2-like n=1 Tax=Prunus yedoensis var. nudiflora TaxID=2094558 RepID=A0A314XHX1_PRUYE|nr:ubiquitin-conjugating enzyme E2 J2-like [Prunus yedoensis var. nudiflora]